MRHAFRYGNSNRPFVPLSTAMSHASRRKRLRYSHRRRNPPGSAPGTLTVDPSARPSQASLIAYQAQTYHESPQATIDELLQASTSPEIRWVNIEGLGDVKLLQSLGQRFDLHPLALEDAVNVHQRPKFEDYRGHLFFIVRMPLHSHPGTTPGTAPGFTPGTPPSKTASNSLEEMQRFHSEQVSIYLGPQFVITLQELPGDTFNFVRKRLRTEGSQFRRLGADYLAYTLIDSVIDAYFPVLEHYGELVEELEIAVVENPGPNDMLKIHALKRDLLSIRRALWPMRDMLSAILRDDSPLIQDTTRLYLRDCHDHTIQLIDMVETYRELASGLVDIHLSSVSNRMNEVMKVLTIIATIFIPLTFIAGIYGMNFDPEVSVWNMPELKSPYGYVGVMTAMAAIALGLLGWFRHQGWLGETHRSSRSGPSA